VSFARCYNEIDVVVDEDPELLEPPEPSFGQWWAADPEFEPEPEEPCCCDAPEWEFAASAFEMPTPPTVSAAAARMLATTVRLSFDIGGHLLSGTDAPAGVWKEAWPSLWAAWQIPNGARLGRCLATARPPHR
jgi:hypothetical protein